MTLPFKRPKKKRKRESTEESKQSASNPAPSSSYKKIADRLPVLKKSKTKVEESTIFDVKIECQTIDKASPSTTNFFKDTKLLVKVIAEIIDGLCKKHSNNSVKPKCMRFISSSPVGESVEVYLNRFVNYLEVSDSEFIQMLMLLDKCHNLGISFYHYNSIHRLIATCVQAAKKLHSEYALRFDSHKGMFARIAGISQTDLFDQEKDIIFAFQFDFDLLFDLPLFLKYVENIFAQGVKRGIFVGETKDDIESAIKKYQEWYTASNTKLQPANTSSSIGFHLSSGSSSLKLV